MTKPKRSPKGGKKVIKAWGLVRHGKKLMPVTGRSKSWMQRIYPASVGFKVVRVSITVIK